MRGGSIEIIQSGSTTFNGVVGETTALELPFLFRDADHAYHVLDGKVGQGLLDKLAPHGIQGLAFLENGWREMTNNRHPIRSHDSYAEHRRPRPRWRPFHGRIRERSLLAAQRAPDS